MPVYSNSNPLKYTIISFFEEMDVVFRLKGAGGGGGGHPDDVLKDYRGGNGSEGGYATGTVRVQPGDMWEVYLGAGGKRGLSWFLGGEGGPGGSARAGFHGGPGGRQGALGRSSGGGGGGGASTIHQTGGLVVVANGGAGGGGEGALGSGRDAATAHTSTTNVNYGGQGATSASDDGGGGGGGGGGLPGGLGGAFGSGDTGGRAGVSGQSYTVIPGVIVQQTGGGAGGIGGSGDITNNTDGGDGYFEIVDLILPPNRYTGLYTKDAGTWKQPVPSVKYNGAWTQIQEGYVKHDGKWVRVYPPKVSVEINDYNTLEATAGSAVAWNNTVTVVPPPEAPPPTPFYALTASATPVAEGASFTITFTTNQTGTFPYTITGVSSADINGASLTGSFTASGQSRTYTVTSDALSEGQEVFTMRLDNGQASTSIVLTDTSTTPETYALTPNVVSVNEGGSFTVTFTTNQPGSFGYGITGVSSADINGASLSGTFSGNGDSRTFVVTADATTEGLETFSIRLNNNLAIANVTINDTSAADNTPTKFAFAPRFDLPLATSVTSETETITGINVPVPVTITNGQFKIGNGSWTTSGTITDGQTLTLQTDTSSNYNVTKEVEVRVGSGSAPWRVTTRSAPVPTYRITPSTLSVREGESVTFTIQTTDVSNGTVLYWEDLGNTGPQDFTDSKISGTIQIQNNSATLVRPVKADSGVANPAEFIIIKLSLAQGGPALVTSSRVDIIDTSVVTPTYPPRGTLLSTYCQSFDKWGNYADGTGGSYAQLIQANSAECGWKDEEPNQVIFGEQTNLELNETSTSNTVTISGLSVSVPVVLDTGLFASKNGGAFQSSGLSVANGDVLQLRAKSANGFNLTTVYNISIGKLSTIWRLRTKNGAVPVVSNTNWNGVFNSDNARLTFNLAANAVNGPIASARIVGQPTKGTVTIGEDGRTAFYTPNNNGVRPSTISASQAQTYVNYWTDLFPNGIKSTTLAQQHWVNQGISENRYIPTIFSGSDSFTFAVTNQYGESNVASVLMQFTAPSNLPLDDVPPSVTSTSPASGSTGQSVNTDISITFSEAVYPGTGTITMVDQFGTASGSWTNANVSSGGFIVSMASGAKKSNTRYTVNVPAGFVKDIAGNPSTAHSWSFTTADAESPYVIGVDVRNGEVTLVWNENITLLKPNYGIEVIGSYYASGDIESISCGLMQTGPNRTEVVGWTNRFNGREYKGMVEYGSVQDAAGNLNDNQTVTWTGDQNFYPPERPPDPGPPGGGGGVSGFTDITIDAGMVRSNDDYFFSALDLLRGNTGPFVDIPVIEVTSINIKSVNTDINVVGGTIDTTVVNGSALLQIPNIVDLDVNSSTPTSLVGTLDSGTTTVALDLQPRMGDGASLSVDWQTAGVTDISAVPVNLQADVVFSDGTITAADINFTLVSPDVGSTYTDSFTPTLSFGDNRLDGDSLDYSDQ